MIYDRENAAEWPDMLGECCIVCGHYGANKHHMPPKGLAGGKSWQGALLSLCGSGTTGCHGLWHAKRLELRFDEKRGWVWRGESARLSSDEWVKCHDDDFWEALSGLYE